MMPIDRCGFSWTTRSRRSVLILLTAAASLLLLSPCLVQAAPKGSIRRKESASEPVVIRDEKEQPLDIGELEDDAYHRLLMGQRSAGNRGGAAATADLKGVQRREPLPPSLPNLPKALSQNSAVVYDGRVYISGGCDAVNGLELHSSSLQPGAAPEYACTSLSSSLFVWNPAASTNSITELPSAPSGRYQHVSAAVNGKLYLVGGRNLDGSLQDTIDIFDIDAQSWSTIALSSIYQSSNSAAFVQDETIYVAGGYTLDGTAKGLVFSLNTDTLVTRPLASLATPRGDAAATILGNYAYLSGGYTSSPLGSSTNTISCQSPLSSMERYDLLLNEWQVDTGMINGRAGHALFAMDGYLFAVGGETLDCSSGIRNLSQALVQVDSVEVMDKDLSNWRYLGILHYHRFRPSYVVWQGSDGDDQPTIYMLGGQDSFRDACQCFPTMDDIDPVVRLTSRADSLFATPRPTPPPTPNPTPAPTPQPTPAPVPTVAGPPIFTLENDACTNAIEVEAIPIGIGRRDIKYGNTDLASVETAPACGLNIGEPGVWFKVQGTGGVLYASTCDDFTDYDTQITVYDGGCGNLRCVNANANENTFSCGKKSRVRWESSRQTTYLILVHGFNSLNNSPSGNYALWVEGEEPINDRCQDAIQINVGDSLAGNTFYATLDFGNNGDTSGQSGSGENCVVNGVSNGPYGAVAGIWYYTIGTGRTMTVDTCDDFTNYDTYLHVFTGNCGNNINCIGGSDNNIECGSLVSKKSKFSWQSNAGTRYSIFVHGASFALNRGRFVLTLTED